MYNERLLNVKIAKGKRDLSGWLTSRWLERHVYSQHARIVTVDCVCHCIRFIRRQLQLHVTLAQNPKPELHASSHLNSHYAIASRNNNQSNIGPELGAKVGGCYVNAAGLLLVEKIENVMRRCESGDGRDMESTDFKKTRPTYRDVCYSAT